MFLGLIFHLLVNTHTSSWNMVIFLLWKMLIDCSFIAIGILLWVSTAATNFMSDHSSRAYPNLQTFKTHKIICSIKFYVKHRPAWSSTLQEAFFVRWMQVFTCSTTQVYVKPVYYILPRLFQRQSPWNIADCVRKYNHRFMNHISIQYYKPIC